MTFASKYTYAQVYPKLFASLTVECNAKNVGREEEGVACRIVNFSAVAAFSPEPPKGNLTEILSKHYLVQDTLHSYNRNITCDIIASTARNVASWIN